MGWNGSDRPLSTAGPTRFERLRRITSVFMDVRDPMDLGEHGSQWIRIIDFTEIVGIVGPFDRGMRMVIVVIVVIMEIVEIVVIVVIIEIMEIMEKNPT
jgi:hypothetical protein